MKINDKQRKIMRLCGTFLFAIALILTLDLLFNKTSRIDEKYIGVWMIGYKFYSGEDDSDELYTFVQELYLQKNGTFYTKSITTPVNRSDNSVSGSYEVGTDRITLTFMQNGEEKTNILMINADQLCTTFDCERYYTKDKVEQYFPMYNATITSEE